MDPRTKASVLWGVVGGLAFLVLVQGYELLADERVAVLVKAAVAIVVAAVTTGTTYRLQPRLYENESS